MQELQIVTSEPFNGIQCDFYRDSKEDIVMTREQIGTALGYTDPRMAIAKIHDRHSDRFGRFSSVVSLVTEAGKRETTIYNARGIYEICRWSRQPKADAFMDWVWNVIEGLRTGTLLPQPSQPPAVPQLDSGLYDRFDKLLTLMERQYQQPALPVETEKQYLTREELKNYLNMSMASIDRLLAREDFPAKVKDRGHLLIDREILDNWLKAQTGFLTSRPKPKESTAYNMEVLKTRKMLQKTEAAFYIGVSTATFTRIMNADVFYPVVRIGHNRGRVFINREKLDQWLDEQDGSRKGLR